VDGRYYFAPFIGGNRYILCNLKIFKERNAMQLLPKTGDRRWTFDQFIRAAKATTFVRKTGEQVWGYAMPFHGSSPMLEQGPFFWGYGGYFFDPTGSRVVLNSPGGVRGLQFMVDMEHKYKIIPPGSEGLRANDVSDLWNAGRVAMRQGAHSSKLGTERAIQQGLIRPGTVEIYPVMYPNAPGHEPAVFVVADSPCVFKQTDPRKKKLVIEFVKFMTDTRHEREVAFALSTLPTRRSASNVWENDPFQNYVLRVTRYGLKDAIQAYGMPLRDMTNYAMQAALSRQRTPEEALDEFAERGNRFIAREENRRRRAVAQ
jgi:multiple sugar transport system substrate-binding protein